MIWDFMDLRLLPVIDCVVSTADGPYMFHKSSKIGESIFAKIITNQLVFTSIFSSVYFQRTVAKFLSQDLTT